MEFLQGLVQAQALGLSTDEFLKVWKLENEVKRQPGRGTLDVPGRNVLQGLDKTDVPQQSVRQGRGTLDVPVQHVQPGRDTLDVSQQNVDNDSQQVIVGHGDCGNHIRRSGQCQNQLTIDEQSMKALEHRLTLSLHKELDQHSQAQEHRWQTILAKMDEMTKEFTTRFDILSTQANNLAQSNVDVLKFQFIKEMDLLKQELTKSIIEQGARCDNKVLDKQTHEKNSTDNTNETNIQENDKKNDKAIYNTPLKLHPEKTKEIEHLKLNPGTTNQIPPVHLNPGTTKEISPVNLNPKTTEEILPVNLNPRATKEILPAKMNPETTKEISPATLNLGTTNQFPPEKINTGTTNQIPPINLKPGTTNQIPPLKMNPGTTNQITPVQMNPGTTNQIPPLKMNPGTTNQIPPVKMNPGTTKVIPPINLKPGTTTEIPTLKVNPDTTNQFPPVKMNPGTTNQITPVQMNPGTTNQIPLVKMNPETTNQIPPVKMNPGTTNQIPPVKMNPGTTTEIPTLKLNSESTNQIPPSKLNPGITNQLPTSKINPVTINQTPPEKLNPETTNQIPPVKMNPGTSNQITQIKLKTGTTKQTPPATFYPGATSGVDGSKVCSTVSENLQVHVRDPQQTSLNGSKAVGASKSATKAPEQPQNIQLPRSACPSGTTVCSESNNTVNNNHSTDLDVNTAKVSAKEGENLFAIPKIQLSSGNRSYLSSCAYSCGIRLKSRIEMNIQASGPLEVLVHIWRGELDGNSAKQINVQGTGFILNPSSDKWTRLWQLKLESRNSLSPLEDETIFRASVSLKTSRRSYPDIEYRALLSRGYAENERLTFKWDLTVERG